MTANRNNSTGVDQRRTHACKVCQKSFVRAEHLHRHLLSHQNNKPNKCKACGASFVRSDVLRRHTKKCTDYVRMFGNANGVNDNAAPDTVTVSGGQQSESCQDTGPQQLRSSDLSYEQHEQLGTTEFGLLERTRRAQNVASVGSNEVSASLNNDSSRIFSGMIRDEPDIFSQVDTRGSPRPNNPTTGTECMRLDISNASGHLFMGPSPPIPAPDRSNTETWPRERSILEERQTQKSTVHESAVSLSANNNSHAGLPPSYTQSFPGTQTLVETDIFDDDFTFLEDFLLPECVWSATGSTTPIPLDSDMTAQYQLQENDADATQSRLFWSKPPSPFEKSLERLNETSYSRIFDISPGDIDQFQHNSSTNGILLQLPGFSFPKRSRILRCLSAYFENIDPHVPIIQHSTFSLCGTNPALVLAMLAMGATSTSEHRFAISAYNASCALIDQKIKQETHMSSEFEFWPIQTLLLCAHFGAFSDNEAFTLYAQEQLSTASRMLRLGLSKLNLRRSAPQQDWASWSFIETFSRLALWTCSLNAILLSFNHSFHINTSNYLRYVPLPLDEDVWRARSMQEWSSLGGASHQHSQPNFLILAESLFQGKPILDRIDCFGLFSLIGWILLYICNHERVTTSVGSLDTFEADFTRKMGKGLETWETLTRHYLRTGQAMFRKLNPLISDSFPLLGSAYYHLHMGEELRILKEIANSQEIPGAVPTLMSSFPTFAARPSIYKAVRYAVNSWLVRAKLGISHFQQSPDIYGSHGAMGAYEAALVLSWWLTVSQSTESSEVSSSDDPVGDALNGLLGEVFAEVEDQDISCKNDSARALAPLQFCRRTMERHAFPYSNRLRQSLDNFHAHVVSRTSNM